MGTGSTFGHEACVDTTTGSGGADPSAMLAQGEVEAREPIRRSGQDDVGIRAELDEMGPVAAELPNLARLVPGLRYASSFVLQISGTTAHILAGTFTRSPKPPWVWMP